MSFDGIADYFSSRSCLTKFIAEAINEGKSATLLMYELVKNFENTCCYSCKEFFVFNCIHVMDCSITRRNLISCFIRNSCSLNKKKMLKTPPENNLLLLQTIKILKI